MRCRASCPTDCVPTNSRRSPRADDAADFLYVGEWRSCKGVDTLIEALALVARRLRRSAATRADRLGAGRSAVARARGAARRLGAAHLPAAHAGARGLAARPHPGRAEPRGIASLYRARGDRRAQRRSSRPMSAAFPRSSAPSPIGSCPATIRRRSRDAMIAGAERGARGANTTATRSPARVAQKFSLGDNDRSGSATAIAQRCDASSRRARVAHFAPERLNGEK